MGKGSNIKNCKRMAINALVEQMCEEEGVGFVDLWGYVVGKEDMYMRDGLHLSRKGAAVFPRTCFDRWTMEQVATFLTSLAGWIHREAKY